MKIEVFTGEDGAELISTFTVQGIDEISESELLKKENVTKPRVTLSFELTRTGLLQLNKAEAKVDETYTVEVTPPANKTSKKAASKQSNETDSESANTTDSDNTTAAPKPAPEKILKKRSIPYSLNRIDRVNHGSLPFMTREAIQKSKDRLRWYERKDEERTRTDKAKNDFESVIYAMREWLTDNGDKHRHYLGADPAEAEEQMLAKLSESEEWLLDGEGEHATYVEYTEKYNDLNGIFSQLKMRKDEH